MTSGTGLETRWESDRQYARLRNIDRAGIMWEWLRRDPEYIAWHASASKVTRASAPNTVPSPLRWGLHFRRKSGPRSTRGPHHLARRFRPGGTPREPAKDRDRRSGRSMRRPADPLDFERDRPRWLPTYRFVERLAAYPHRCRRRSPRGRTYVPPPLPPVRVEVSRAETPPSQALSRFMSIWPLRPIALPARSPGRSLAYDASGS